MSVFDEWADFAHPIFEAQKLIHRQRDSWHQDELDIMALRAELNFLYTSLCYNNTWSSDAAQEFKEYVQYQFLQRFNVHPFKFEASEVLDVLRSLEVKLSLLKLEVSLSCDDSLSTPSLQPPSTFSWSHFYCSLQSNMQYLSRPDKKVEEKLDEKPENKPEEEKTKKVKPEYKSDYLDSFLKKQLKTLLSVMNSLEWLIASRYYVRSPWVENMRAHFGGLFVQIAHLCCFCWYKGPLDKSRQKDVGSALSDLCRKLDPASLEFLETALGFLRKCDEKHAEVVVSSFLYHVFDSTDKREILHRELATLLTYLIKVPGMDGMDVQRFLEGIKYVVREARYLKGKYWGGDKADLALLFAKIWSLKAEIFVQRVGTILIFSKKVVTQALYEGCKFLDEISTPTKKSSAEDLIVQLIHKIPKQVKSFYQCLPDEGYLVHQKVNDSILKSLVSMMLLKAKALLLKLMQDVSFEHIGFLHEGLFFLVQSEIIQAKEITGDEKPIFVDMEAVASGVIFAYNKFQAEKGNEGAGEHMKIQISNLLAKVHHLKAKLKALYLQIPTFILPKTRGFFIIQLLLAKLSELLISRPDSIDHTTHQIEIIHWDLEDVVLTIKDVAEPNIENLEFDDLHAQLVDKAYQVEHVIDIMLGENEAVWQHILWLYHLSEQIRDIKIQLTDSKIHGDRVQDVPQSQQPAVSQVSTSSVDEVFVGSNKLKEKIIDLLTWGKKELQYVSVVGMAGIGKTTLANNVFCSQKVRHHFLVRAWCCVSHNYKERDVLTGILSHMISITEITRAKSTADLHNILRKQLKGKRYLVVLDDVWSTKVLEDFSLSFPKDEYGSRILLTSRLQDDVSKISMDVLPLHELSTEESWELLKLKIFGKEKCPEDLLEVGLQIAENCKGLPLAIGAIAGLLDRTCGRSQVLWKGMARSVSSQIIKDPETQCKRILELSYNHLPNHLKACLLYFGAFPEDKDIPVQRLQWLWISEGFVCDVKGKNLEDLAKEYLRDLIGRSLVIVGTRKSNGEVKDCRVHDVVRDLCLLKAKDDIFMQLISADDEPYSSLDKLEFGLLYESFNASNAITYDQYRLCVCVDRDQFVASRPSGPFVRSLIFSGTTETSRCSYDVSFIPENFKRLRLLDLESINMGNTFGSRIELLVQLRYLAFCGDMEFIPPSLSKLQNLVILNVEGLKRKVVLPETIWKMKNLRHIHVSTHTIFSLPTDQSERSFKLDSLVTLSLPYFLLVKETNEILQKLPSLQKLKCVFSSLKHSSMDFLWPPALESLLQLKSLNISYYGQALNSGKLALPGGLRKLTLSKFSLSCDHISEIGRLENLEILKLISCAFEGPTWDMTEGQFSELQYLELENLNIVDWNGEGECLPVLQHLVMRNCEHLKNVDIDFCSISTLDKIEVWLCSSIYDSLREMQELGHEKPEIVIHDLHST